MIESVKVIGRGRVGSAVAARLQERSVELRDDGAEIVLLCVPDAAIAETADGLALAPSQWIAHTSGATPLSALSHERRFGLHPLQTFDRSGDPRQLDGAYAAVTGETDEAQAIGRRLAELLGLRPFSLAERDRALYHAGAAIASNYLVTLHQAASDVFAEVGAPPAGLEPLMRRVVDNGFELTGPIARGDWETVERHLAAMRERMPRLEALYRVLAEATAP